MRAVSGRRATFRASVDVRRGTGSRLLSFVISAYGFSVLVFGGRFAGRSRHARTRVLSLSNRDAHTGPYSLALRRASGQLQSDTQPSVSSPPHSKPCRRACGGERLRGATITRDTPRLRDLDRRRADARRRRSRDAPTRTRNSSPTEPRECRQQWHAFRRRDRENRVCRRA